RGSNGLQLLDSLFLLLESKLLRVPEFLQGLREGTLKALIVERSQAHWVAGLHEAAFHGGGGDGGAQVDLELCGAKHLEPELDVGDTLGEVQLEVAYGMKIQDDAFDEVLIAFDLFFAE